MGRGLGAAWQLEFWAAWAWHPAAVPAWLGLLGASALWGWQAVSGQPLPARLPTRRLGQILLLLLGLGVALRILRFWWP
jgi:hypothetical protein